MAPVDTILKSLVYKGASNSVAQAITKGALNSGMKQLPIHTKRSIVRALIESKFMSTQSLVLPQLDQFA